MSAFPCWQGARPTLILTWIPNATLQKNPKSIENSPSRSRGTTPKASPRRTPRQEFAKTDAPLASSHKSSSWDKQQAGAAQRKKRSQDDWSLSSDVSCESREETVSPVSSTPGDDSWRAERKLSSSCKSQTDSGIGTEEPVVLTSMSVTSQGLRKFSDSALPALLENSNSGGDSSNSDGQQNNTKPMTIAQRQVRVGINVNDLNANGDGSHTDNCDVLTAEEQLAAMLSRPKLHAKRRSGGSVGEGGGGGGGGGGGEEGALSIHMAGDNLVVVSDGGQAAGTAATTPPAASSITDRNLNTNDSKFDTSTASSSQSTDNDSPAGLCAESPYSVSSPNTLQASPDSSVPGTPPNHSPLLLLRQSSPHRGQGKGMGGGSLSKPPCLLELPGSTPPPPNTPVETPDIAITRPRSSSSSTTTSGPDSPPLTPVTSDAEDWDPCSSQGGGEWSGHYSVQHVGGAEHARRDSQQSGGPLESPDSSCSSASVTHNMTFPENSMSFSQGRRERRSARDQVCGVFSVDLGE